MWLFSPSYDLRLLNYYYVRSPEQTLNVIDLLILLVAIVLFHHHCFLRASTDLTTPALFVSLLPWPNFECPKD